MPPRSIRPRLLLPLLVVALLASALLTASAVPATDHDLGAGAVCKNAVTPARKVVTPRDAPTCVTCRAPLLNAPVAQADRETTMPAIVALPPAA